jgi:hypothetical protein
VVVARGVGVGVRGVRERGGWVDGSGGAGARGVGGRGRGVRERRGGTLQHWGRGYGATVG